MVKVSVIIPTFNSSTYIFKCIDSLKRQTMKDFEVVFVDDCSADSTIDTIKQHILDATFKSKILKMDKNSGPGAARNFGLDNVNGEYVIFIDSDDWISDNYFERMLGVIEENKCDVVICDYIKAYNTYEEKCQDFNFSNGEIDPIIYASICNDGTTRKIINRKIIENNKVRFPEIKNLEDVDFCIKVCLLSKKIYYLNEYHYYYYQRNFSLSNSISIKEIDIYQDLFNKYINYLEVYNVNYSSDNINCRVILDLIYNTTIMMLKANISNKEIRLYLTKTIKKHKKLYKNYSMKLYTFPKRIYLYIAMMRLVFLLKIIYNIKIGREK